MPELQLAFQSYEARANQFSQQRLINLFWEQGIEGTKSEGILYKRPGLKAFATVGLGPIRGVQTVKGIPFVVSGFEVFTVNSLGVSTNLGTLTGSGLVDMADNGEQVAIVSGQDGFIAVALEVFNTTLTASEVGGATVISVASVDDMNNDDVIKITLDDTSVFETTVVSIVTLDVTIADALPSAAASGNAVSYNKVTLQKITDSNFRSVSSVTFQDAVFVWTEFDTRRTFSSPLLDGLGPYDTLAFASAEYYSDNLVKAFSDHDDLFLCGTVTIEPFVAASTTFPFVPNQGTVIEAGLLARNAIAKLDNGILFFGNAGLRGGRSVWRITGYSAQRISTHALESIWEKVDDVSDSYATSFRLEGHEFFLLTIPDTGTFVYDAATQRWTEWRTFNKTTFEAIGYSSAFDKNLIADAKGNRIFELSFDFFDDAGTNLKWEAMMVPIATENNYRATHNYIRIDMQSGVGLTTGQGSDPKLWLSWANEDDKFGNRHLLDIGKIGETKTRVQKWQLGQARSRTYKIEGTDPVFTAILGVYLELIPGVS